MRLVIWMICSIFLFLPGTHAQLKARTGIIGKVVDQSTGKPIEYATVTVSDRLSKKIVTGAIADAKGSFAIRGLPAGNYLVAVEFIGYQPYTSDSVVIGAGSPIAALNTVYLVPSSGQVLQGVTITSKTPLVENKIDKIVYNVANDITSQGGVALDVLKKVPQVTVDIDGNVELQGDANIRFLINGKPSSVFGNSLADALASIPASQIKSIEAITSPGAKYDAQGTGGIINIILKDNRMQGINGNINLSAGTRLENGSLNLNVRHNNFGVNAFFSGNAQLSSHTPNSQNRLSFDTVAKTSTRLLQEGYTDFSRKGYESGIGFEWNITKKDDLSGSFGYDYFGNHSRGFISQEETTQDASDNPLSAYSSFRNSDSRSQIHTFDWSLDYRKKFKKEGEELEFSYNASYGNPSSSYIQEQTYTGQSIPYFGSSSNNPGTDKQTNLSLDYVHPVTDKFTWETGVKTVFQNIYSRADVSSFDPSAGKYAPDTSQSYHLNYGMKIFAGYFSASFRVFDFLDIKAGARYEYTDINIDYPNTSIPSYGTFVPSIILSHKTSGDQTFKLAYTHRIERPEYMELNPFMNLSDPYNITTGNPLLKPEIGDNFELGYNRSFGKGGNIYMAVVERINSSDIKQYTNFYPSYKIGDSVYNNVSVISPQNIGTEYNTGIILSGSVPINTQLNIRGNFMGFNRHIVNDLVSGANGVVNGLRVRFNMNATYQLPHNLVLEAFGNFNGATVGVQGKLPQFIAYTFAFRKQFWNKKASVGFTATNAFSKYIKQVTTIATDSYYTYNIREVPYRSFGISLTYKFGKLEFKKSKENNDYLNNPPPETN